MKVLPLQFRRSLFFRLASWTVVVQLLCLSLATIFVIAISRETLKVRASTDLDAEATRALASVQSDLRMRQKEIVLWSSLDVLGDVRAQDHDRRIHALLARLHSAYATVYRELDVLDVDGLVVASTNGQRLGTHFDVPAGSEQGQAYSDLARGVVLTHPIRGDAGNQAIGTLVALVDWNRIQGLIRDSGSAGSENRGLVLLLLDGKGTIIAGQTVELSREWKNRLSAKGGQAIPSGTNPTDDTGQYLISRVAATVPGPLGANWGVVAFRQKSDAFVLARVFTVAVLVAGILSLLVGALATFRISAGVSERFRELTEGTTRVARGDLAYRVNAEGSDELARLAVSFNTMTDGLAGSVQALEDARNLAEWQSEQLQQQTSDLLEARDGALAATRAKSHFLANMSHELRTPLTGVIGMSELLMEMELEGDQKDFATTIHRCAYSLLSLVNEILDFSKIEAGRMTLESSPFDVREVIEEVAELLGPTAFQKGLELIQAVPPQFPSEVLGDRTRLRQILVNLVGNAIKFTENGEVTLETELARETHEWIELRLLVRDTGIGINQLEAEKIFESFTQADDSSTRKYGGTGLGLAISRSLVELMGGRIGVESTPGRGSTFWIQIAFPRGTTAARSSSPDGPKRWDRHILIIDDCASVRSFLREHLDAWGCLVDEASSWHEGLKLVRASRETNPFSAILLDLTLPDIDPEAVADALGDKKRLDGVPLLLLAPPAGAGVAESARLATLPRVRKPLRTAQLKRRLLRIFEKTDDSVESTAPSVTMDPSSQLAGLRVLLAEDNLVNQKLLHLLLSRWGCDVDVVSTGKQALAAVARKTFDVILMDVQMPDVDGITVTTEIRQREAPGSPHLPIIAITAHAFEEDRRRCLAAGMDDFVSKPPDRRLLALMLARWCRGSSLEPEKQGATEAATPATFQSEVIYSLFAGNATCARDVLSDFADKLGPYVEAVRSAAEAGDRTKLKEAAHSLKGSSRSVGARALSVVAGHIEEIAPQGEDEAIRESILRLEEERQRLHAVLEQHLRSKAA